MYLHNFAFFDPLILSILRGQQRREISQAAGLFLTPPSCINLPYQRAQRSQCHTPGGDVNQNLKLLILCLPLAICSLFRLVVFSVWSLDLHQHHLETCYRCRFSGLIPDQLNERVWAQDPAICILASLSGDSDAD